MCVCNNIFTHTRTRTHRYIHILRYVWVFAGVYYTSVYTTYQVSTNAEKGYIFTHTNTHTHTHRYIHILRCVCVFALLQHSVDRGMWSLSFSLWPWDAKRNLFMWHGQMLSMLSDVHEHPQGHKPGACNVLHCCTARQSTADRRSQWVTSLILSAVDISLLLIVLAI